MARGTGAAVRLLPVGHADERGRPVGRHAAPHRRADRRHHDQPLPLRHLQPRAARDPARGGGREMKASVSRRTFLEGLAAGGLLLSVEWPARAAGQGAAKLGGWLRIAPDGTVTLLTNTSEIGQGTNTALAQLVADELDLPWDKIRLEMAPVEKEYFNPGWQEYATYGSGGVAYQAEAMRLAGARARTVLIEAAARRWKVPAAECTAKAGVVNGPGGRSLGYGALARAAAQIALPEKPPLKS